MSEDINYEFFKYSNYILNWDVPRERTKESEWLIHCIKQGNKDIYNILMQYVEGFSKQDVEYIKQSYELIEEVYKLHQKSLHDQREEKAKKDGTYPYHIFENSEYDKYKEVLDKAENDPEVIKSPFHFV